MRYWVFTMLMVGGALELLQHRILLDADCDDDDGDIGEHLARQVDGLDWLGARELVDRHAVMIIVIDAATCTSVNG